MTFTDISTDQLPTTIRDYLTAHTARDVESAAAHFAPDAVVTDQDETFRGEDAIRDFLTHAGAEFTYTTELVAARRVDDDHWVATNRIEGDFPGGVAELDYRFTLVEDRIAELAIAPR